MASMKIFSIKLKFYYYADLNTWVATLNSIISGSKFYDDVINVVNDSEQIIILIDINDILCNNHTDINMLK